MPLSAKGRKILSAMRGSYGSEKKAKSVFYASINSGKITGAEKRAEGGPVSVPLPRPDPYREYVKRSFQENRPAMIGKSGGPSFERQGEIFDEELAKEKAAGRFNPRAEGGPVKNPTADLLRQRPFGEKLAKGGPTGDGAYLVGEKGPELFVPQHKGAIVPNKEVRKLGAKYAKHIKGQSRQTGGGVAPLPIQGSDEWKSWVADAIAKHPTIRTQAEKDAIAIAMGKKK